MGTTAINKDDIQNTIQTSCNTHLLKDANSFSPLVSQRLCISFKSSYLTHNASAVVEPLAPDALGHSSFYKPALQQQSAAAAAVSPVSELHVASSDQ